MTLFEVAFSGEIANVRIYRAPFGSNPASPNYRILSEPYDSSLSGTVESFCQPTNDEEINSAVRLVNVLANGKNRLSMEDHEEVAKVLNLLFL
jgi:hypothetical protein